MKSNVLYIIIAFLGALVLFFIFKEFSGNKSTDSSDSSGNQTGETGTISGTIEYSGLKPQEGDTGEIYMEYRVHDTGNFEELEGVTFPLQDHAEWEIEDVPVGVVYDGRGVLKINGEVVARSNTITVTAPATDEVLEFNVTWEMLPQSSIDDSKVELGGYVIINGYIPENATLSMFAREKEKGGDFAEIVAKTPVTGQKTDWVWSEALPGVMYELKTEAYNASGGVFASSFVGEKAAPSDNAYFILTSHEGGSDSSTNQTVSGVVKVNGDYSSSSTLHIKARVEGESEYKTVTTLNPSNSSQTWSWDEATGGVYYDFKAFLVEQSKDDISGNTVTTKAPASNVGLKVDTDHKPSAPDDEPELSECKNIEDNKFEATLKFKNVEGADKYRLLVGKSKGSGDVNDSIVNNSGSTDPTLTVNINQGQDYYSQYAYTKCEGCDGNGEYSDFSDSLKFKCD